MVRCNLDSHFVGLPHDPAELNVRNCAASEQVHGGAFAAVECPPETRRGLASGFAATSAGRGPSPEYADSAKVNQARGNNDSCLQDGKYSSMLDSHISWILTTVRA